MTDEKKTEVPLVVYRETGERIEIGTAILDLETGMVEARIAEDSELGKRMFQDVRPEIYGLSLRVDPKIGPIEAEPVPTPTLPVSDQQFNSKQLPPEVVERLRLHMYSLDKDL